MSNQLEGSRVLVLGRMPEVLETVTRELAELGVAVQGTTEAESATERFDAAQFDLIAFGRGLVGPLSERLRQGFAQQNPSVRFLDTFAPQAVGQIVTALEGKDRRSLVDLDAYCARIGYHGERAPTLETLRALQELHPAAIVFENLDVLMRRGIDISPAAVDAKLIARRRGGYCFEHNSLFKRVLTAMGFEVEGLVARVHWMAPAGSSPRPRTHMALRVTVDGQPWLADVGFGGCVPTAPLAMDTTAAQPTRHETYRVIPFGDGLLVQAQLGEEWNSLYELSLEPQLDVDYELPNWYTATHPSSHFLTNLSVARTTPEARYTLSDGRLTVRTPEGDVEKRSLAANELEQVLRETFGLPVEPAWWPVIERAASVT
ncbi:arylamine N-acetyltransferase family protein [Litchfieldella anticariensis]|uniref:arylamine N-acetyltransferase family protein n=1 Tax=Litchfieldella anticariensis TaxID=258591 RepID=UPI000480CC31|nr:arylamine N-acetyltransferase [Halomonas anticariensis]